MSERQLLHRCAGGTLAAAATCPTHWGAQIFAVRRTTHTSCQLINHPTLQRAHAHTTIIPTPTAYSTFFNTFNG